MKAFTCYCEKEVDLGIDDTVDLDEFPNHYEAMKENRFLVITCPHCGATIKPEVSVRVVSRLKKIDYFVIPELERLTFYRGKVKAPAGSEVLIGYPELFERIRILDYGLNHESVEVIKYYLQCKAEESDPEGDITIYFRKKDAKGLIFNAYGFSSGDAAEIPVPLETYSKISENIEQTSKQEPFSEIFSGSYRSMKKLAFEAGND
jgi:hypothetical protein